MNPKPKLLVELVPSSSWGVNLRSILTKTQWDTIRRGAYKKAGYTCEVCGGVGKTHPVECHEEWEYNDITHTQTLVGVKALCPDCHGVKHLGLAATLGRMEYTKKHLMGVNGWGVGETNKYIKDVWEQFKKRSQHPWDVVVGWINNTEEEMEVKEMAKGKEKTKVSVFNLAPKLSERFQRLILERNRIAGIEKSTKEEKKAVNVDLEEAFTHIDNDTSVVWDGFGSVGIVESTRSSINKDLLKEELLRLGLGVDVIVGIVEKASKISTSISVKFTSAKK